jgi:hypothetical protein
MEGLSSLLKNSFVEGNLTGIKVSRLIKIIQLLFMDDVIIMTREILYEFMEIDKHICLFCKASGLLVNQTKTTAHFEGLTELELTPFKTLIPYNFSDLSNGFRYLGYFLKTGTHHADDWEWLVSNLTKNIGLWCNKWLSMRGRYILVKIVLEGQPVYWMSMEAIPRTVINKIRKLMFHFLWNGQSDT